jgi:hypothetical protein
MRRKIRCDIKSWKFFRTKQGLNIRAQAENERENHTWKMNIYIDRLVRSPMQLAVQEYIIV